MQGPFAMMTRLFACLAAAITVATSAFAADGQTVTAGCNCAKCQAIRQAAQVDHATYGAMPAGLFAAPAPLNEVQPAGNESPVPNVQSAGHHHPAPLPPTNCPPGGGSAPGWGLGPQGYGP